MTGSVESCTRAVDVVVNVCAATPMKTSGTVKSQ